MRAQTWDDLSRFCIFLLLLLVLLYLPATTAKSLQSCPTLCDPIDGSTPGSPVRGILQARTLEWVTISLWLYPGGASGKEHFCQCRRQKRPGFDPWVGKIPQGRVWQPAPVFLPGESQGRGSLVGCHLWGCTESDTTEAT